MINENKKKTFAANVAIIFIAQILVKILGMVYRMVITNIKGFGDAGNGYYSAGFQIYTLLLAISSVGIPNAISKLISEKTAVGDYQGANRIFKTAFFLFALSGLVLSGALYVFAVPIAKYVIKMDGAELTMRALAPSILFVCVSSVMRGYFSGMNNMKAMSSSQVLEQFFKSALTILFVIMAVGCAPEIMAAWANFATTLATVISTLYLFVFYKKHKVTAEKNTGVHASQQSVSNVIKSILAIAIPISLCSVITAVNRIIDTATITRGIETAFAAMIPAHGIAGTKNFVEAITNPSSVQLTKEAVRLAGLLSKSDTLINLPLALNIAFATVLVPSVSGSVAMGNNSKAYNYINFSMLVSVILVLPCVTGYIVLAKPIYRLIYPNASLGYDLLQYSSIALIFTALNQTVTGALQGFGMVKIPVIALLVGCLAKIVLNTWLISMPQINIYGAVISSIVCQFIVFVIEFVFMSRNMKEKTSVVKLYVKPIICCLIMSSVAYYSYKYVMGLLSSNAVALFISIALSAIVYTLAIFITGAITSNELMLFPYGEKIIKYADKLNVFKK